MDRITNPFLKANYNQAQLIIIELLDAHIPTVMIRNGLKEICNTSYDRFMQIINGDVMASQLEISCLMMVRLVNEYYLELNVCKKK